MGMSRKRRDEWDAAYMKFRNSVLKRDRRLCQFPGCKEKATDVHHIRRAKDEPELRCSVQNGISCCRACHSKVTGKEAEFESIFTEIVSKKSYPRLDILGFKYSTEQ